MFKKNRKVSKIGKRAMAFFLAGTMVFSFAACGKETKEKEGEMSLPEYTYVPEYVTFSSENLKENEDVSLSNAKIRDGKLYYPSYIWDGDSRVILHEYSMEEKKDLKTWELHEEESEESSVSVIQWDVLENGDLLMLCQRYQISGEDEGQNYFFRVTGADQKVKTEKEIGGNLNKTGEEYFYIENMAADKEGRVYLAANDGIYLFDSNLNFVGMASTDGWINCIACGKDGKVYCSSYDRMSQDGGYVLYHVDFEKKALAQKYEHFVAGEFTQGKGCDFLVSDSNYVYAYDLEKQTAEKLFSWIDCDISGNDVRSVFSMEDGKFVALIENYEEDEKSIVFLTKKKTSELPRKEQIVLGTLYPDYDLSSRIVAFNKNNEKYRVTLKTYYDENIQSADAYNEAITAFNNALTSANAPDIIAMSGIRNVGSLATKGVFEDLSKYLEKSSVVKKEDLFENILESNTFNGTLVTIPRTFQILTLAGKTENVGTKRGWTVDDMIALVDKNKNARIFNYISQEFMLYYMVAFNSEDFIDYKTGECRFNTPEFKKILELCNRFPKDEGYEEDIKEQESLASGKTLLNPTSISEFNEIQLSEAMFESPVTFVGFPTSDGRPGSLLTTDSGFAISAKSKVKEGAWEFIEAFLSSDFNRYSYGFPAFKSKFEALMQEVTKVEYLTDENGEFVLDENGEKIAMNGGGGIGFGDWSYTYHICTKEEAQLAKDIASESRVLLSVDEEMMGILSEEAAPYFAGQKSADEVMDIIQSRIKLYINE